MSATISFPIKRAWKQARSKHRFSRYNTEEREANRRSFYEKKHRERMAELRRMKREDPIGYELQVNIEEMSRRIAKDLYGDPKDE